jgi:hypothetical protein
MLTVNRILESISRAAVSSFAKGLKEPWNALAAVTIVDGETIVGHLGGSRQSSGDRNFAVSPFDLTRDKWRYFFGQDLALSYRDLYTELRIYIPIRDVAGIRGMNISQPVYEGLRIGRNGKPSGPLDEYLSHFKGDERALRSVIRERRQAEFDRESARRWDELSESIQRSVTESADEQQKLIDAELRNFEFDVLQRDLVTLLRATALRTALRHGYQVARWPLGVSYLLTTTLTFKGDLEPRPGERLYVDWDYVRQNREGLTGAGFGWIASMSLQWNTSDARAASKLAKKRLVDLRDLCLNSLAFVRGYIAFLGVPGSMVKHDAMSAAHELTMDDGTWLAAIICDRPIAGPPARGIPWILSYWKKGSEVVPFEMLDTSVPPLEIFGSVHSGDFDAGFGNASCFLKVHFAQAAAS